MSMTKFNMTYGLYLGIGFIIVIILFHVMGHLHFPGDQSGWVNSGLVGFAIVYVARKFQLENPEVELNFRLVSRIGIQLSFFSSIILAFFIYWYYGFIAEGGISNFIDLMQIALQESGAFEESQQTMLIEMYRSTLNPGIMAFTCGFSQFLLGVFLSLIVPLLMRFTNRFIKK